MGGTHAFWATSPNIKKCFFTMSLETPSYSLFFSVVRVSGGDPIYQRWTFLFLFSFFFLFFLKITIWSFWLLVVQLQSLFFWFLIFGLNLFVKVLFIFNFIILFQFIKYYILQFDPISNFLPWLFCKSFLGFNFIIQFKLMILCYPICFHF
jgi:hypothetical protein